jgi:hypothetical protein
MRTTEQIPDGWQVTYSGLEEQSELARCIRQLGREQAYCQILDTRCAVLEEALRDAAKVFDDCSDDTDEFFKRQADKIRIALSPPPIAVTPFYGNSECAKCGARLYGRTTYSVPSGSPHAQMIVCGTCADELRTA